MTMCGDWFTSALDEVIQAAAHARAALATGIEMLELARDERASGVPVVDVLIALADHDSVSIRRAAADAIEQFQRSLTRLRAGVVRALVDEYGLTITEVARRMKVSRQMASRLYDAAQD